MNALFTLPVFFALAHKIIGPKESLLKEVTKIPT